MHVWQIEEQVIEDNATKLRLEFSSVHTDEVNAGNPAPSHDNIIMLRLWTSARDRVATFIFARNGRLIRTEVEPVPGPADVANVQPGDIVSLEKPTTLGIAELAGSDDGPEVYAHAAEIEANQAARRPLLIVDLTREDQFVDKPEADAQPAAPAGATTEILPAGLGLGFGV